MYYFCQLWASCVQTHHFLCSPWSFSFLLCCRRTNMSSKKNLQHFNNECFFFSSEQFHQLSFHHSFFSILVIFCSWLFFVFKLVTLVVLPCSPFLCCERKNMSSKEKLKCWISEHHLFSSEQVHQLPPHDYNLCDMVILCSWLLCVQVHHPYDVPLLLFLLWKKEHQF